MGEAVAAAPFRERAAELGLCLDLPLQHEDVVVDLTTYRVLRGGADVPLTPRQVELLALFVAAPERVWTRDELHLACWGDVRRSRRVDVQLTRLRHRMGLDLFRNVRDRGWSLRAGS